MRTSAAIAVLTGLAVGAAVWWSGGGRPAAGPIAAETRAAEPGTDAKPPAEKPAGDRAEPADAAPREEPVKDEPVKEEPVKTVLSGRVVLLKEAFQARGIKSYDEEIAGQVVLLTREGELVPIVPDGRGRAFYQDERLRNRPADLVVLRRKGVPWVQVLSIYTFDESGARCITDYWCDVCSIPMYEIKECDCCRGPIHLRLRPQELPEDLKTREKTAEPSRK